MAYYTYATYMRPCSSSFGGFDQQLDQATSLSSSSSSDFGDFDQQSAAGAPGADSFGVTCQVTSQDFPGVADVCYGEEGRNSRVHHSSPKKLLDDNFVWTQVRISYRMICALSPSLAAS